MILLEIHRGCQIGLLFTCITIGTITASSQVSCQAWWWSLQVGKMSLFNAWYTKSSSFDEFEIAQNQTIDQSGNGLRDNWVTSVQLAFKSSFKDVGELHCIFCVIAGCPSLCGTHWDILLSSCSFCDSLECVTCGACKSI